MGILIARSSSAQSSPTNNGTTTSVLPLKNIQKYVLPGNVDVIDSLPTASTLAVKWYLVISTLTGSKSFLTELVATEVFGAIRTTQYGSVGDDMNCNMTISIINNEYVITVSNGEVEPLLVYATRLFVPPTRTMTTTGSVIVEHTTAVVRSLSEGVLDLVSKEHTVGVKWLTTFTDANRNRQCAQVFALSASSMGIVYSMLGDLHTNTALEVKDDTHTMSLCLKNDTNSDIIANTVKIPITPAMPMDQDPHSDVSIWIPNAVTIQPGAAVAVDSQIPMPGHAAVKWMVVIQNTTAKQTFELMASQVDFTSATHTVYGITGDSIPTLSNVNIDSMFMALTITNNSNSPITVNTIRIPIAI